MRLLRLEIILMLGVGLLLTLYVMTAPPVEPTKEPPKLEFYEKSDIRRRPSLESFPFARAHKGTRLEILGTEGHWAKVKVEGSITGWAQLSQGFVISPPPPELTRRQRAKQRLQNFLSMLVSMF